MKLRVVPPLAAALFAALALGLVAGASATAADEPSVSRLAFSDPAGDAAGAPDLTNVAVTGDARTGMLAFTVSASGTRAPSPDGLTRLVAVVLDTDSNPTTGNTGSEYMLLYLNDPADWSWDVVRWDGSAWQPVAYAATMGFGRTDTTLTWRLSKADLGGSTRFTLGAVAALLGADGTGMVGRDRAPAEGEWIYDINGPTRSVTHVVKPLIGKPVLVPTRPRAGRRVTLSVPVKQAQGAKLVPLTRATMSCNPTIAGRTIAHAESLKNGLARLSFVVPKTAKGKTLKLTLTIKAASYRGEDGTFVDVANGRYGVVANVYKGGTATKVASFPVR
jgi:hypothetical protein